MKITRFEELKECGCAAGTVDESVEYIAQVYDRVARKIVCMQALISATHSIGFT